MNFHQLPRRLWWSHHLAFLLHDYLASVVTEGEQSDLFFVRFPMSPEEAEELDGVEDIIEWMEENSREAEARAVIARLTVHGLLSDMCQFLFESLTAAAKGKVSVAYALLRKPFRDQLFLLEWLLVDREGFLAAFETGPEEIDISWLLRKRNDWVRDTVRKALEESQFGLVENFDFIWELRFDKSAAWSLESFWNRSLHLVTTNKHYTTETQNLNFAFCDAGDRDELQHHYYRGVAMVLTHMWCVVSAIIDRWDRDFLPLGRLFDSRVVANYELALRDTVSEPVDPFGRDAVNELFRELDYSCDHCKAEMRVNNPSALADFVRDLTVRCPSCGEWSDELRLLDEFDAGDADDGWEEEDVDAVH